MLNHKEKRIVQILIKDRDEFVTSRELAKQLNCSDRTIRTYYKSLLEKLESYDGIELLSKQGHGYKFHVSDEDSFSKFLQESEINTNQFSYSKAVDKEDRYNYLLNKLLFEQNDIYFDDLVDELFVSRSTLSSDFRKIRKEFAPYHLKVESKANKGVYVTGLERDKRRFIMDYFVNTLNTRLDDSLFNIKISFEELTIIVLDECREGKLKLSDFVIQNLVIHIALAIRRITEGFQIAKITENIDLLDLPEREVARKILDRITVRTGIDFPIEEVDYITLHLISKGHGDASHVSDSLVDNMRQELVQAISVFSPEFDDDFQLVEGLLTHMSTMLIRLESQVILENPLTAEIQSNYADMFLLAEEVMSSMSTFSHFYLSADEIAYIALHFMAAKERYKEQNKYNILVICATGYGSAQMLKSRIENELGNLVHINDVIGYYEINDDKLKNIDFIVSSIDLSNLIFSVPVFTVSVFLNDNEIQNIKQGISHLNRSALEVKTTNSKTDTAEVFEDYFSKEQFLLMSDTTKEEVLEKLVATIAVGEDDSFERRMKDLMFQREQLSSVVFSDAIAVPHPIKAVGNRHHIAVALVPEGLYWDEQYQKIKFVFLTSMSMYDNEGLPELASSIVDLVDRPDLQEKILESQSFEQFKEQFLKIKER